MPRTVKTGKTISLYMPEDLEKKLIRLQRTDEFANGLSFTKYCIKLLEEAATYVATMEAQQQQILQAIYTMDATVKSGLLEIGEGVSNTLSKTMRVEAILEEASIEQD